MESLLSDTVQDILSRVPAESVLECKLVCKRWGTLIRCNRSNYFANFHLRRQLNHLYGDDDGNDNLSAKVEQCLFFACRIDNDSDDSKALLFHGGQLSDRISIDEKFVYYQNMKRIYHPPMHNLLFCSHLVGSCNGLVCMFQIHHLVIDPNYICNPLTREYVYLPELVVKKEGADLDGIGVYTACGFGYARLTNEYKVVRIHYLNLNDKEGNVEAYTLGSGCGWRAIGKVSYRLDRCGTYAIDAIYWTSCNHVVAFDLADEEFRLVPVPHSIQQGGGGRGLVVLGGRLCFYTNCLRLKIWSLKRSSDSRETWCMEFDIDHQAVVGFCKVLFEPILLTKNGEIIFLYAQSVLYCYDTKTAFFKMISDEASTANIESVEVIAHMNTFESLEAMGESSKRYTVRPLRGRTPLDDVIDELDRVALCEEIDTTRFRLR